MRRSLVSIRGSAREGVLEVTDSAKMEFGLIYFTEVVKGLGADVADPFSFADVSMDARRCADGHWRIARFDSAPVFIRSSR